MVHPGGDPVRVDELLRQLDAHPGVRVASRAVGHNDNWIVIGVNMWRTQPPPAWSGQPYTVRGHGLSLILAGQGWIEVEGRQVALGPGDVVQRPSGSSLSGRFDGPGAEIWLVCLSGLHERLYHLGVLHRQVCLHVGLHADVLRDFLALHQAVQALDRSQPHNQQAAQVLVQALNWVQCCYRLANLAQDAGSWAARIHTVCRRMEADLAREPDLDDLARGLGISTTVLRRRFREVMGCPPCTWYQRRRLEEARRLLASERVAEVATRLGFGNPLSLTRLMRRHLGVTPVQLRRSVAIGSGSAERLR
jgi:AraC-like DNA-binding protein